MPLRPSPSPCATRLVILSDDIHSIPDIPPRAARRNALFQSPPIRPIAISLDYFSAVVRDLRQAIGLIILISYP